MSAQMMWCPNCEQMVAGQRKTSHRAIVVLILAVIGIVMLFQGWLWVIAGTILLIVDALLFIVGFVFELSERSKAPHCPICKGENLLPQKPRPVAIVSDRAPDVVARQPNSVAVKRDAIPDLPQDASKTVRPPSMPPYSK